jgi:hypothetical protein
VDPIPNSGMVGGARSVPDRLKITVKSIDFIYQERCEANAYLRALGIPPLGE